MFFFKGDLTAPAIIMDHCRETGQSFTMKPVESSGSCGGEDDRIELNPNYIGKMPHGANVLFKDAQGQSWVIKVERLPMNEIHQIESEKSKGGL